MVSFQKSIIRSRIPRYEYQTSVIFRICTVLTNTDNIKKSNQCLLESIFEISGLLLGLSTYEKNVPAFYPGSKYWGRLEAICIWILWMSVVLEWFNNSRILFFLPCILHLYSYNSGGGRGRTNEHKVLLGPSFFFV